MELSDAIRTRSTAQLEQIIQTAPPNSAWLDSDALVAAIKCGRKDVVNLLLEKDCRTCKSTAVYNSPLHLVIKQGDTELIYAFLKKGAPLTIVNAFGNTPLHLAFMLSRFDVVDLMLTYMLKSVSCENTKNNQNLTHMHIACSRNNFALVKRFIENRVNLADAVDKTLDRWSGYTALHFAAKAGANDVVKMLLSAGADHRLRTGRGATPRQLINRELVESLMTVDSLTKRDSTITHFDLACMRNDTEVVKKYLQNNALDHEYHYKPLYYAVKEKRKANIKLLLNFGAQVVNESKVSGATPVHEALYRDESKKDDCSIIDTLWAVANKKMTADGNDLSYLHVAATRGDTYNVKKYLDEGHDVNSIVSYRKNQFYHFTPLHFSVKYGQVEMTRLLLKRGANVHASDDSVYGTPLLIAASIGNVALIELLLEYGANVYVLKPNNQETIIHLLVRGYLSVVQTSGVREAARLLEIIERMAKLGVDVNAKDSYGDLALHIVSIDLENGAACGKLLLELGTDINLVCNFGYTPLTYIIDDKTGGEHDDNPRLLLMYNHVRNLLAMGLYVSIQNELCLEYIRANIGFIAHEDEAEDFEEEAMSRAEQQRQDEVDLMESIKITSRTSLHDFMLLDSETAVYFVPNSVLRESMKPDHLNSRFPILGYLMKLQYERAIRHHNMRLQLINDAASVWYRQVRINLPHVCLHNIFSHMKDDDLRFLINSGNEYDNSA